MANNQGPITTVLASSGNNSPPAAYGSVGEAHIVGSSATAGSLWAGHSGELAINDGLGGYNFVGKAAMKDRPFMYGGVLYTYSGTALVASGTLHSVTFLLAQGADATTGNDKTSHVIMPFDGVFVKAWATAKTGPTSASLLIDINKNGTTVFTTQSHRVTIAAAATTGNTTGFDVATFSAGDELSVDIDQIGSGTAGKDITVVLSVTQS